LAATKKKGRKPGSTPNTLAEIIRGTFEVLATGIDRFGWPGLVIILVYIFIERYASLAQKREFIDLVLHPNRSGGAAFLVFFLVSAIVFLAQQYYWKQRDKAKDAEIKRLADWKTQHQQRLIPEKLHHTTDDEAGRSPKIPRTRRRRNP
jgi:hypothetical protein